MGYPVGYNYEYTGIDGLGIPSVSVPIPASVGVRATLPCPTTVSSTFSNRRYAEGVADNIIKNCIPGALAIIRRSGDPSVQARQISQLRVYVDTLAHAARYLGIG